MVNELAKKWGNRIKFVDDLTVAEIIPRNPPSLLHMIVEEEIHRYAVTNRMKLNPRKCKEMITNVMTYDNIACRPLVINGMVVERVNSYKLLGLIINNTLSSSGMNIPLKNARELLNVCLDFANLNKQELIIKIS
jgi:hypothetical protein